MKIEKEYLFLDLKRHLPWLVIGIFLLFVGLAFLVYRSYLIAFFSAFLFYMVFRTPHIWLRKLLPEKRNLTAAIGVLSVMIVIILPLIFIGFTLAEEAVIAVNKLSSILTRENFEKLYEQNRWIDRYINIGDMDKLQDQFMQLSKTVGIMTLRESTNILAKAGRLITNFIFSMFILFFLFRGADKIGPIIYRTLPFPDDMEEEIGRRMIAVLDAIIKGNLFISLLQGAAIGILFWIFGLSTPILYGTIASFFALIPVIGTMIIWVPAAIYLYSTGHPTAAFVLGALALGIYLILENLLKPWLLDRKLNLHPLFLFLAILGGISEFGLKGLILGPFIVIMLLTLWEMLAVWNEKYGSGAESPPS